MGLDTTHGCWHGPYSQFMRWRVWLAKQAGMPSLYLMEGFFTVERGDYSPILGRDGYSVSDSVRIALGEHLPIRWESLKRDPLHRLLSHSDCEGHIPARYALPIAKRLEQIASNAEREGADVPGHAPDVERGIYDSMIAACRRFAKGLREAAACGERVEFR